VDRAAVVASTPTWSTATPGASRRPWPPLARHPTTPPRPQRSSATAAYHGDLLEGADYDWAEPAREEFRRQADAAAGRLAELLTALETAAGWDPYNEELHQRIMRLQAHLGRPDAVRRTLAPSRTEAAEAVCAAVPFPKNPAGAAVGPTQRPSSTVRASEIATQMETEVGSTRRITGPASTNGALLRSGIWPLRRGHDGSPVQCSVPLRVEIITVHREGYRDYTP